MAFRRGGRPGVLRRVVAAALMLVVAAGCRPPGRSGPPPSPDPKELEPGIVRAVDLLLVPGLQPMQRLGADEAAQFDQPTLVGPCGATIPQPQTDNRLVAVFVGETAALTEAILVVDESEAEELVASIRDDIRPDCPPQTAVGQDGETQTYRQGPLVDIGRLAEDRVATLATLELGEQRLHLGTILLRRNGTLIQALLSSEEPVEESTVRELARVLESASLNIEDEA
ncbi:MAG TPA: hypothetical protein VHJ78_10625 [Actinomycetota bacterium]|nr:hypothetical protein [Actinomycetota bacterium]